MVDSVLEFLNCSLPLETGYENTVPALSPQEKNSKSKLTLKIILHDSFIWLFQCSFACQEFCVWCCQLQMEIIVFIFCLWNNCKICLRALGLSPCLLAQRVWVFASPIRWILSWDLDQVLHSNNQAIKSSFNRDTSVTKHIGVYMKYNVTSNVEIL